MDRAGLHINATRMNAYGDMKEYITVTLTYLNTVDPVTLHRVQPHSAAWWKRGLQNQITWGAQFKAWIDMSKYGAMKSSNTVT